MARRKETGSPVDKRKTRSQGPAAAESCDLDNDMVMADGNEDNAENHQSDQDIEHHQVEEDEDEDEEEDEDASLVRLSEQYRRFSESQRELEQLENNTHENNDNDHHIEDEDDDDDHNDTDDNDEDEDDSQSEDMMRSIHRANEDHEDDYDHSDEDEEEGDLENELLQGAFRSFANRLQRSNESNDNPRGEARSNAANSLAENMARMFPEAMGLFGGFGAGGAGGSGLRISGLIDGLKRRDDPYLVLETLNELSERLLMMNGLVAERGLPAHDLAHGLVDVLTDPFFMDQLELQLVACRCLYNFLEINNDYVHSAVHAGAIEALQSKLLEISYIDLAEQSLQTLEIISKISGTQIFRRNCLLSCLQYLDFFTIHAQRKAINITANSVKYIKESEFEIVEEIFPILQRIVVEFSDSQALNNSWLAISRIIKNFRSSPNLLTKLINTDLLNKMISVISNPDTNITTNLRLINTLSICARNDELSILILKGGKIGDCIKSSLSKYKKSNNQDDSVSIEALMAAPKDLIISILDLIINLLPSEKNSILTIQFVEKNYSSIQSFYEIFINEIFQLLINIYSSTVIFDIRRRVMISLIRIVSSLDDLTKLGNHSQVVNLLASIVIQNKSIIRQEKKDQKPYMALLGSLILTQLLAEKDPEKYLLEFEREGLIADTSSLLEILRVDEKTVKKDDDDETMEEDTQQQDEEQRNSYPSSEVDEGVYDEEEDEEDEEDEDEEFNNRQLFNVSDQAIFKNLTTPQIIKHLTKYASDIEQEYLSKKASGSSKLEHLRLLDEISAVLKDTEQIDSYNYNDWVQIWNNFKKALGDEKTDSTISSFELISSGFIEILSSLFSNDVTGDQKSICRNSFLDVFNHEAFELLIKKLQEALTRSESFEILSCGLKTGENRAASLGKQIKVKLIAEDPNDEQFEGMSAFIILVHAIASFNNINSFLKRRVETPFFFRQRNSNNREENRRRSDWHIEFLIDDEVIPYDSTIYGALFKNSQAKNPNFDSSRFWFETHEIKFRKVEGVAPVADFDDRYPGLNAGEDEDEDDEDVENLKHPVTLSILSLLKILHDFDDSTSKSFLNFKLTAKLNRQLEEPLIVASGILPSWAINITRKFPFLFPLDTRIFFLQSTSFGYSRLIQLWTARANQDQNNAENDNNGNNNNGNGSQPPLGRPTRQKVRVPRNQLLQSSFKVLDKLGSHPSILEVEFTNEVGTGLGPTLEFYALVSKLYCQKSLGIWRQHDEIDGDDYVNNKNGLFPSPIVSDGKERLSSFKYLGKFVARALLDNRIVDFYFNKVFFQIAQSIINKEPIIKDLEVLKLVDEGLYNSLIYLQKNKDLVEGLEINFTLPGFPSIELIENGSDINVDSNNVDDYISKVVDFTIGLGVEKQVESFIKGFSEVFPYSSMLIFSPNELVELLGNANEDWSYETLISAIHADHGYTVDSPSVQNLITLMTKFSKQERRLFLQFLTGSPRLPIGGFKNLKPVFTVVLKHSEGDLKPDNYLPSVMTCANYLKLPNYSSSDILEERLMKAVNEGAGAFLLS